ncbi:MAG: thioesterase family protein [Candidatus Brocadiia bacterium]
MKTEIQIYYEDTDCGGVVYYANYLRFYERARTDYLAALGLHPKELMSRGVMFAVVTAQASYLKPARYGDTIVIESFITEVSKASFVFGYKVCNKETGELINQGSTKIVAVEKNMKVWKLEPWFMKKISAVPK